MAFKEWNVSTRESHWSNKRLPLTAICNLNSYKKFSKVIMRLSNVLLSLIFINIECVSYML
jgi:hypothetical protein